MRPIPNWANKIVEEIIEQKQLTTPKIKWIKSKKFRYYAGYAFSHEIQNLRCEYHIRITIGKKLPRWEQKLILLHELAHYICKKDEHHNEEFWTTAFILYRRYKLPMRKALQHESAYRKRAHKGYLIARRTK